MHAFLLLATLLPPADTGLLVSAVRFYRADPGQSPGVTQVTAMLRIPAEFPTAGAEGEVSLDFTARVVGATGVLYEQSWRKRTARPYPRGAADRLDVLSFTLASGEYRLEASVTDSVSGRKMEHSVPIVAYGSPPQASDLLLSSWVRPVAPADTLPQPGEFRRGGMVLAIAPAVEVGGANASVAYLVETYSGAAATGSLTVTIADPDGRVVRRTEPAPVTVAAGIGLLTGRVEVGDLGAGRYLLAARLGLGAQTVTREAWFEVDPEVGAAPASLSDREFFGQLAGDELDRAFGPLAVIARPGELAGWPADGSDGAKRAFLARFWRGRDPTPGTGNERRARFYDGALYVEAFYADSARGRAGWETGRGRVFLREGLAPQVLRRKEHGGAPTYEVWRYFDRPGRFYVFAEVERGGVELIRSNDPLESDHPRWQEVLTPTGVREVVAFLGRAVLDARN